MFVVLSFVSFLDLSGTHVTEALLLVLSVAASRYGKKTEGVKGEHNWVFVSKLSDIY
jgi:hypothetical protein